jgi:uncharacterized protein YicC (UPF0701 family)
LEKLYEHSQKCTIKHQILILQKFTNFVDVKEEDKSEESKQNHIRYYKSLSQTIADIREEEKQEHDPTIKGHLEKRIEAMEKDKIRIKEMFPDIVDD